MSPLVVTIMGLVSPYLVKGADEFVKAAGKDAYDGVKALVGRLSDWWSAKPALKAAAETMAQDPQGNADILADALQRELARDPVLEADLRALVDRASPFVDVVLKMETAEGVTGARIEELARGRLHLDADIKQGKDVVVVEIRRMG